MDRATHHPLRALTGRDRATRLRRPGSRSADRRLLAFGAWLLLLGAFVSAGEMAVMARLTAPVRALDLLGATIIPFGLISLYLGPEPHDGGGDGDGDDEDGHGGIGGPAAQRPLPPPGGPAIDWPGFEEQFRAYARSAGSAPPPPARCAGR